MGKWQTFFYSVGFTKFMHEPMLQKYVEAYRGWGWGRGVDMGYPISWEFRRDSQLEI
jgi:hypothetical protein